MLVERSLEEASFCEGARLSLLELVEEMKGAALLSSACLSIVPYLFYGELQELHIIITWVPEGVSFLLIGTLQERSLS